MAVNQTVSLSLIGSDANMNTSEVRFIWKSTQSGDSFNTYERQAYYDVTFGNGHTSRHYVTYSLPQGTTTTIVFTTITVPHDEQSGFGSVTVKTWMDTDISAGVIEKTVSYDVQPIDRKSTLSAPNGVLCEPLTLTITPYMSDVTHTINYYCGAIQGNICEKTSETSISWTPPPELAAAAPSGNEVAIELYLDTYLHDEHIDYDHIAITCTIPDNGTFVPVLLPTTTDAAGLLGKYGRYIPGESQVQVDIETYGAYGAWITSVKTEYDGITYTGTSFTTNRTVSSGFLKTMTITVEDSRGRISEAEIDIRYYPYKYPTINSLKASRCDASGNLDASGAYLLVEFSSSVFLLQDQNNVKYYIAYQKSGETSKTEVELQDIPYQQNVSSSYVIPADPNSSYAVTFTVVDDLKSVSTVTTGPSGKKVWSLLKSATEIVGMAFGKIAELEDVLDIGWQTRMSGGILHSVLGNNTDLNNLLTPTTYMLLSSRTYANDPENGVGAFLEIVGIKDGSLIQRYSVFDHQNPRVYERIHYETTGWNDWICVRGDFVVEQGVKSGWTYRKWNSGVAECWKTVAHTTKVNNYWSPIFVGNAIQRQNYPFTFTEKPVEIVSLTSGGKMGIVYPEQNGYGVNGVAASAMYNVCALSSIDEDATYYFAYNIKGKWK